MSGRRGEVMDGAADTDPITVMSVCPACGYPSAGLCATCRQWDGTPWGSRTLRE
jgi:hypothetical protein